MRTPSPWQRKSTGCWFVQINGKKISLGKDAKVARAKYHRIMARGKAPSSYTVRQIVQANWDWCKSNLAATTCERREPVLNSFMASVTATLKGEDLRAYHVQKWVDANRKVKVYKKADGVKKAVESDKNISPTTAGDRISIIKGVMSWAKRQGYVESNPIVDMQRPTPRIREEFLPAERWQELLGHAKDERFADLLRFVLLTGARDTEVKRLVRAHFVQDAHGSRFVLPIIESKGRKKPRVIRLSPEALAIVEPYLDIYRDNDGNPYYGLGEFHNEPHNLVKPVFTNSKGRPWAKSAMKTRFLRLKRLMKMPTLCMTTLRHSYGHYRLVSGQDSLTVSKLMGHVDTRMLATRYGHLEQANGFLADAAGAVPFPSLPDVAASVPV